MKREKEKVKGVTEILCKAKFSREFFASYLYENFFVDRMNRKNSTSPTAN